MDKCVFETFNKSQKEYKYTREGFVEKRKGTK